MIEVLEMLQLQTDLPDCSMTEQDIREQEFILSLMHATNLPPHLEFNFITGNAD